MPNVCSVQSSNIFLKINITKICQKSVKSNSFNDQLKPKLKSKYCTKILTKCQNLSKEKPFSDHQHL